MKNSNLILLSLIIFFLSVSASLRPQSGTLKGRVTPPDAATGALAISNIDTFRSAINNGEFVITGVKQGSYNIIIQAKSPYKNAAMEGVMVTEDGITDVGEIKLTQQ